MRSVLLKCICLSETNGVAYRQRLWQDRLKKHCTKMLFYFVSIALGSVQSSSMLFYSTTREECEEKLKVLIAEMKKEIAEIKAGEKAINKG